MNEGECEVRKDECKTQRFRKSGRRLKSTFTGRGRENTLQTTQTDGAAVTNRTELAAGSNVPSIAFAKAGSFRWSAYGCHIPLPRSGEGQGSDEGERVAFRPFSSSSSISWSIASTSLSSFSDSVLLKLLRTGSCGKGFGFRLNRSARMGSATNVRNETLGRARSVSDAYTRRVNSRRLRVGGVYPMPLPIART